MSLITRLTIHHAYSGLTGGLFLAIQTLFLLDKGASLWQIGILFGTYGLSAALFELPLGAAADIHGRIKIYRLSLLASLIGFVAIAFIDSFALMLLACVLLGLGRALESGTVDAWQVEQINKQTPNKLAGLLARFQATNALAIAIGALAGGYLPMWTGVVFEAVIPSANNLLIIGLLIAIHIAVLPWLFKEPETPTNNHDQASIQTQIKTVLKFGLTNSSLKLLLLVAFVFGLALANLETYWQPFVKLNHPEVTYGVFGWLAMGYFLSAAIGPMFYAMAIKHTNFSANTQIGIILGLTAPLLFLLGMQHSLIAFAAVYFLFMTILSSINIPIELLMNEHVSNAHRSTMYSVFSLTIQAGGTVSAYGLASVVQHYGIAFVWQILAVVLFFAAIRSLLPAKKSAATSQKLAQ